MTSRSPSRTRHGSLRTLAMVLAIMGALACLVGCGTLSGSLTAPSAEAPFAAAAKSNRLATSSPSTARVDDPPAELAAEGTSEIEEADGRVSDGVSVFEDTSPAIERLDPALLGAFRQAAVAASRVRVTIDITSGWRSNAYQKQLFASAVSRYGSIEEAARWVARPGTSAHEKGTAADVGPAAAAAWLTRHGTAYGLCQIYINEPWHYELRLDAVGRSCPVMYADAARDLGAH